MKVIIADTADLVRIGISAILASLQPLYENSIQIRESEDLESFTKALKSSSADIAVVDAAMVEDNMSSELVSLVNDSPNTHWVLMAHKVSRLVLLFVKEHPNFSLILKSCNREEIQSCMRMAAKRQQLICNECMKELVRHDSDSNAVLTPAECMVLALLAQGLKVKDIAELQFRSKHTIRTHKRDIFEKLGVNTTVEAIMAAYKLGIINPPER